MKIRTIKHMIKEGIVNTYKNKLMTLASASIVIASLVILGIFLLIAINLNYNINSLKEQPEIIVYCIPELTAAGEDIIEQEIKNNPKVADYNKITKAEAFEEVREMFEGNDKLLEGYTEDIMQVSFDVAMINPEDSQEFVKQFEKLDGVESIKYSQDVIDLVTKIIYWINFISSVIIIILIITSVSIIANTIKLTVFARKREIAIMKYIGATDWFIRWPFIIEGILIGLIGAGAAFILVSYGYNAIEAKLSKDLVYISSSFIKFRKLNEIGFQIIMIYSIIGVIMGGVGSIISIRKYLKA